MHLAAESHVDRSITGAGRLRAHQRARHPRPARGGAEPLRQAVRPGEGALPLPSRLDRRGLRLARPDDGSFTETTAYAPRSPYSASKAASDHLVAAWGHTYGLPALISNCSNNYGPCQFPEKLIPLMILNALEGKPLPVYGDGLNVRDWLHVEDHARRARDVLAEGRPGETYAIGARSERTNQDVVAHALRHPRPPAPRRARRTRDLDHARARPARPRPALRHRPHQDRDASSAGGRR